MTRWRRCLLATSGLVFLSANALADITAVVALDRSASLKAWCDSLLQDFTLIVKSFQKDDRIVVLAFDEHTEILGESEGQALEILPRIRQTFECRGRYTSLSSALETAWQVLSREPKGRKRILFLLTDGVPDMGSQTPLEIRRLRDVARRKPPDVQVVIIGYVNDPRNRLKLLELSELMKAQLLPALDPQDLRHIFSRLPITPALTPSPPTGRNPTRPRPGFPPGVSGWIVVPLLAGLAGVGLYAVRKRRRVQVAASAMDLRRPHPPSPRAVSLAILDPTRGTRRVETLRMLPGDQATVGSAMTDTVRVEGLQPRHLVVQVRDAEEVWLGIPEGIRLKVNGRLQRGPAAVPVPPEGLMVETGTLRITLAPEV